MYGKYYFSSVIFVTYFLLSLSLSAQERIINRDVIETDLGNGRKQMIIQDGQNYYKNGSWHKYDFAGQIQSDSCGKAELLA